MVLRTWKLTLEYDGTRYSGWQEQTNARTIAGNVRQSAEDFLQSEVELHGSGRTDAGVHALAQVAHLRARLKSAPQPHELRRALNEGLPADIAVLRVEPSDNKFHARHDAVEVVFVPNLHSKASLRKKFVWWVKERLDLDKMSRAAAKLAGRHDFICFRAPDPSKPDESTIVVVNNASVTAEDDLILFQIEASHFLWRMVRRIVGVLVKLGKGDLTEAELTSY